MVKDTLENGPGIFPNQIVMVPFYLEWMSNACGWYVKFKSVDDLHKQFRTKLDDSLLSEEIEQQSMAPGKIFHDKESGMWLLWSLCLDYPTFYENAKIFAQDLKRFHSHPDAQARLLPTNGVLKMEHDGRRKARLIAPAEGRQRLSWGIHRCRQRNKGQTFHGTCCTLKLANMAHWYHYCFINVSLRDYIYILLPEGHEKHGMCGRLLRTIYGLKQSSRECLLLLTSFLLGIWFE